MDHPSEWSWHSLTAGSGLDTPGRTAGHICICQTQFVVLQVLMPQVSFLVSLGCLQAVVSSILSLHLGRTQESLETLCFCSASCHQFQFALGLCANPSLAAVVGPGCASVLEKHA